MTLTIALRLECWHTVLGDDDYALTAQGSGKVPVLEALTDFAEAALQELAQQDGVLRLTGTR